MSTDERSQALELERHDAEPQTAPTAGTAPQDCEFEPHAAVDLSGTLACGQPAPRTAGQIASLCVAALEEWARQVTRWTTEPAESDARLGDYRFLVVDYTDADGVCRYVQLWSEPGMPVTMEVGPGERDDVQLQQVADELRAPLAGRGFEIGGGARNFRKFLAPSPPTSPAAIAAEMLGLLTEVLHYDGTADLTYRLCQGCHLSADHVVYGMSRSQLADWMAAWGLRPHCDADLPTLIVGRDRDQTFRVLLRVAKQNQERLYWEIHAVVTLPFPNDVAAVMLEELNAQPNLYKVFAAGPPGETTRPIGIAVGINLAGGVTPAHIRSQLLEWLDAVRQIRQQPPSPPPSRVPKPAGPTIN